LIIKDFIGNNIPIAVISSVVAAVVLGYFYLLSDQKAQIEKVDTLKKDVTEIISKYESQQDKIDRIDKEQAVSRAEFLKDLEFIKTRLGLISNNKN